RLASLAPEWSPPNANRSVLLAGLPPGRHRLEVRAVTGAARPGGELAAVAFEVLPPLWRRGWFLATAGLALAMGTWAAYRYRIGNLLAVERVRTRIASDLHDEVGASLSRIGILAEVGKLRLGDTKEEGTAEAGGLLSEIGETSRELSEEMSDIVWSLDPRRDDLPSLIARLRRFASDVLEARGVALDFSAPESAAAQRLSTGDRRELYLLLKEAIHNAARHSRASRVMVSLAVRGNVLLARVEDDGTGLPAAPGERSGHGLDSMRRRAGLLGGRLTIESAPGEGTLVRLEAPLSAWRRARFRRSA
ncbi:MAG TPA: ATP-binding protein, partial [Thermoanaerobaculia bacterium]|nr:ATP-binding protein [Thermoanaerobaculia bacterium]